MKRVHNFSAGPAMIPQEVLEKARRELLCYGDSGMSVMEMSHRSSDYKPIIERAESLLRELLGVDKSYKILFLQGGATQQFSQIPMNLLTGSGRADYIESGNFAQKAAKEASRYGKVQIVASSAADAYNHVPSWKQEDFDPQADYFHITTNNTIFGTRFTEIPETGDVPLVADMSSNILAEDYDFSKFSLIYAGAQKNIGPSGVTVVIVKEDILKKEPLPFTPSIMNYHTMIKEGSMYNTPSTYSIYVAMLVFEWIIDQGGIPAMKKLAEKRAAILYDTLDQSRLFKGTSAKKDRSLMNITFITGDTERDNRFVAEAKEEGLVNLKGHRLVGGIRASIYNAMPIDGVEALADFMKRFEKKG